MSDLRGPPPSPQNKNSSPSLSLLRERGDSDAFSFCFDIFLSFQLPLLLCQKINQLCLLSSIVGGCCCHQILFLPTPASLCYSDSLPLLHSLGFGIWMLEMVQMYFDLFVYSRAKKMHKRLRSYMHIIGVYPKLDPAFLINGDKINHELKFLIFFCCNNRL